MQCLILAGGLGTRIKAISGDKPKALLPVGPQTFIDWQLQWLKLIGVPSVVMALGHGSEKIVEHIEEKLRGEKKSTYPEVKFCFDGPKLLGTGGAIRQALDLLDDDFIVTYGDTVVFLSATELLKTHRTSGLPVTLTLFKNQNQGDKSNVIFKDGKIIIYDKFNRVPEMEYIDYGMSVLNKKFFKENTVEGVSDYSHFLTEVSKSEKVGAFMARKLFLEVGSMSGYNQFCETLKNYNYDLNSLVQS